MDAVRALDRRQGGKDPDIEGRAARELDGHQAFNLRQSIKTALGWRIVDRLFSPDADD